MTIPPRRIAVPIVVLLVAAALLVPAAPVRAQLAVAGGGPLHLTPDQAIAEVFGDGVRAVESDAHLSGAQMARIASASGSSEVVPGARTWSVYQGERLVGYAMVLDERGKYRPITFLVGTDPAFQVRGVEVLAYREDRGGEVQRARFLRQYRGKTLDDPIRTHRDIVNVTGATISVTSMNTGVRRALATLQELYGSQAAGTAAR